MIPTAIGNSNKSMCCIVAVYHADILISFQIKYLNASSGEYVKPEFELGAVEDGVHTKVFLINSEKRIIPICKNLIIE